MTDPFVRLGVPEDADDATVKKCHLQKGAVRRGFLWHGALLRLAEVVVNNRP